MSHSLSASKVLLISIFFPPERSGGATGAWNRAVVLHNIGYAVFVLTSFPAYPTGKVSEQKYRGKFFYIERMNSFVVIRLRLLPIEYIGYLKRLIIFVNFVFLAILYLPVILRITGKGNMTIIYARSPVIFSSFIGWIYSLVTRSFFIYEAPDLWPEELAVFKTKLLPLILTLGKFFAKLSFVSPNMIVTISELAAEYININYKPKCSVYGIPVGVEARLFPNIPKIRARAELVERGVLPPSLERKFIVLYSGIISPAQGIENMVYAADHIKNDKEIAILIVGEGPDKDRITRLKSELNLANLYVLPSQLREMMPFIISSADVCAVLLSSDPIYRIALPTKFYEYLACCKPIIGICQGELAEIINQNNIGKVIDFGDIDKLASTIKDFKNSSDITRLMENNCNNLLHKFSLDEISYIFKEALRKAMG